MKKCASCKQDKQLVEFHKNKTNKDALQKRCKNCRTIHANKNILAKSLYDAKYYSNNREKKIFISKMYSYAHKSAKAEYDEQYRIENMGKRCAWNAKRKAAKRQRTPKWLTEEQLFEIEEFYILAKELRWLSEEQLHVDHIVPLQGEQISGLHVPWNLQILPAPVNISKGNRFDLYE